MKTSFLADAKIQLGKGHAEMKKQTAEAVETAVARLKADIARVERDRQHFVSSLADAMNEITHLRNNYKDYDECEGEKEEFECYELDKWYKDDTKYREATGVGDLDYGERVQRATTLLFGMLARPNLPGKGAEFQEPPELIPTTEKAAHAAAISASDMTHNTKAYEKLSVPTVPNTGVIATWMYSLGTTTFFAG